MLAVQVLVEAIIVVGPILEKEGRRPSLAGAMATLDERRVVRREASVQAHALVPLIGQWDQTRVERSSETLNQGRQRVTEVSILATPESMPSHEDVTAEAIPAVVKLGYPITLTVFQQVWQHGPPLFIQFR